MREHARAYMIEIAPTRTMTTNISRALDFDCLLGISCDIPKRASDWIMSREGKHKIAVRRE